MKEVLLFLITFLLCLGALFGWLYIVEKQKKAKSDLKSIEKNSKGKNKSRYTG